MRRDAEVDTLGVMLSSEGWTQVALPSLKGRLERQRRALERAALHEVERLQSEIGLLRRLIEEPHRFLKPETDKSKGEKA